MLTSLLGLPAAGPPKTALADGAAVGGAQGGLAWELGAAEIPEASAGDPFQAAKAALATTAQPRSLPCRTRERAKIEAFVRNALLSGAAASPLRLPPACFSGQSSPAAQFVLPWNIFCFC